jgi:hypothetical protein
MREWQHARKPEPVRARQCSWGLQPMRKQQGAGRLRRCVSSSARQSGDPGGRPEPEADCEPPSGRLLGVLDEIQVLERPTEARMPEPAVMRAREVPGEQTTVATAASVGERVQKTARLFNPHGLPSITWEGGEDESALKDIRKQSAAQRVPAQLRSSFQPEPRREATCTEHPKEPVSGKMSGTPTIKTQESIVLADRELSGDREDAMHSSRRAEPQDETVAEVQPTPPTNAVRGRRRTGQAAEVAEALIPSPTSKDPPTARNGRLTASGMSAGATEATADEEAARETGDEELQERGSPVEVQQMLHQEEAAREAGDEELPERGSAAKVQHALHQEETGREAGAENFPERGTLWSLQIDAGREMRRPIIVVAVEEACGKRGGNGKEDRESCGNGDKRPAGIAAPREEWEDFVGAVEDKGDEDDPPTQPGTEKGIQFQDIGDGSQGSGT